MTTRKRNPKPKPPFFYLTVSTLGVLIHTALRKNCDSTTSSLAWNAIGAVNEGWMRYLEEVLPSVREAQNAMQAVSILHARTNVGLGSEMKKREHQDLLIRLALAQLSMTDWCGIQIAIEDWASTPDVSESPADMALRLASKHRVSKKGRP
jgi:hypothetical protein